MAQTFSGLGPDVEVYAVDICMNIDLGLDPEHGPCCVQGLAVWGLRGSEGQSEEHWPRPPHAHVVSCIYALVEVLLSKSADLYGDDIVELCGGAARVTRVCVRRCFRSGGN